MDTDEPDDSPERPAPKPRSGSIRKRLWVKGLGWRKLNQDATNEGEAIAECMESCKEEIVEAEAQLC